jgi:hypothetical protein
MIHDADNHHFTTFSENSEGKPRLRFRIYPREIIIDSNGDSFQTVSVTETIARKYLAEKAILFRSFFRVANEVKIQSGTVSLAIDGSGNVTSVPLWTGLPDGMRTRLTLLLSNATSFEKLVENISSVPDTLLLFRSNLRNLQIEMYPAGFFSPASVSWSWTRLKSEGPIRSIIRQKGILAEVLTYFIAHEELQHLPDEVDRPGTHEALVLLAFPLSEENVPVIREQPVYSFLPVPLPGVGFGVSDI